VEISIAVNRLPLVASAKTLPASPQRDTTGTAIITPSSMEPSQLGAKG
jgi:hypothetical protein